MGRERQLVAAALRGEPAAFGSLVGASRSAVQAVVARMLPEADVEDVVQEAFLRAFLGLSQLREPGRFLGWVCGIAVNLAKMRLRRGALQSRVLAAGGGDAIVEVEPGEDERELLDLVRHAVELLPPRQRAVVLLHYVDDLSCEEIAGLLGTTAGAVRVRLHRARAQLRRELAPFAPLPRTPTRKERVMVEMKLEDVLVRVAAGDPSKPVDDRRIVLLREEDAERLLPIWIGSAEGNALAYRLVGDSPPRPMTSDLMVELLRVTGGRVEHVAVTELREKTFYASVTVAVDGRTDELDARPSDALNLAIRVAAPILAAEAVLEEASLTRDSVAAKLTEQAEEAETELAPGGWASVSAELLRSLHTWPPK